MQCARMQPRRLSNHRKSTTSLSLSSPFPISSPPLSSPLFRFFVQFAAAVLAPFFFFLLLLFFPFNSPHSAARDHLLSQLVSFFPGARRFEERKPRSIQTLSSVARFHLSYLSAAINHSFGIVLSRNENSVRSHVPSGKIPERIR